MKHGMKIILASAASLAVLAGCEGATDLGDANTASRTSTSTSTPTTTYEPPPMTPWTMSPQDEADLAEAAMESTLMDNGIYLPPGIAAEYADIVCRALDRGESPHSIASAGARNLYMYDLMEHALMVGAAVGSHCEWHRPTIEALGGN